MLAIDCIGSPYEIGFQHGSVAKLQIERCIAFYAGLFKTASAIEWAEVLTVAQTFEEPVRGKFPDYFDELQGVANGAGVSLLNILALNVRTEIAFGRWSDGCTSMSWHTEKHSFLAQNWDWDPAQQENLILLNISQPGKPRIQMVTEAGIIGKIGFNSAGVGVCMNAIRSKGVDLNRIPVHMAMRMVLECSSAKEAVRSLGQWGVAGPVHLLISDTQDSFGCEFTSTTHAILHPDSRGRVIHSNHLLLEHADVVDTAWLADSPFRIERMLELTDDVHDPSWMDMHSFFTDRKNAPAAICRAGDITTLFNIIMDLKQRRVVVRIGLPYAPRETLEIKL